MKVINGQRADLERELLEAIFTPDAEQRAEILKTRLKRRGMGRLRVVSDHEAARPALSEDAD